MRPTSRFLYSAKSETGTLPARSVVHLRARILRGLIPISNNEGGVLRPFCSGNIFRMVFRQFSFDPGSPTAFAPAGWWGDFSGSPQTPCAILIGFPPFQACAFPSFSVAILQVMEGMTGWQFGSPPKEFKDFEIRAGLDEEQSLVFIHAPRLHRTSHQGATPWGRRPGFCSICSNCSVVTSATNKRKTDSLNVQPKVNCLRRSSGPRELVIDFQKPNLVRRRSLGRYHILGCCYRRFGWVFATQAAHCPDFCPLAHRLNRPLPPRRDASSYSSNRSNHSSTSAFSRYSGSGFNFRYRTRNRLA